LQLSADIPDEFIDAKALAIIDTFNASGEW
jgi:hypothetical protein